MTYTKPEVVNVGPAITAIQAAIAKGGTDPDSLTPTFSVEAYRSDE